MSVYKLPSVFSGETTIFHYPASKETSHAVLVLKGLYGQHVPTNEKDKQSWDSQLIKLLQTNYNIVLFNTGRHNANDKKEAFAGKTFQQECYDVRQAFAYCKKNMMRGDFIWSVVAMSFGGTVLMGCPDILQAMKTIVMIGSGCGKSLTTTKPLLSTLPDTSELLKSMSEFQGLLYFLRGGKDTVVPEESQKKIYENTGATFSRGWIEFSRLDHELNDLETGISHTAVLASRFLSLTNINS